MNDWRVDDKLLVNASGHRIMCGEGGCLFDLSVDSPGHIAYAINMKVRDAFMAGQLSPWAITTTAGTKDKQE